MQKTDLNILNLIAQTIYDKKGFNILALDVRDFSTMGEYYMIAEGNVDRHVISLAHAIMENMKEAGHATIRAEGLNSGDWVIIDFGHILIHLFMPEVREKFALEELWKQGHIVDVVIKVDPEKRKRNE